MIADEPVVQAQRAIRLSEAARIENGEIAASGAKAVGNGMGMRAYVQSQRLSIAKARTRRSGAALLVEPHHERDELLVGAKLLGQRPRRCLTRQAPHADAIESPVGQAHRNDRHR